jgi:septum formation protein
MTFHQLPFILASSSARRQELLKKMGIIPDHIYSPDIDETPHPHEHPTQYVQRIANQKWLAARLHCPSQSILLTADTCVTVGKRILPKALNNECIHINYHRNYYRWSYLLQKKLSR